MVVKALVVDDSGFFRRRIVEILNADPGIEVIGTAANGQEAVEQAARLKPDVITMDIEMPVMDGITAVRRIMVRQPMPILMFSSLTFEGAKATLDALEAGAADFLPKRFEDIARDQQEARRVLCRRVRTLGMRRAREREPAPPSAARTAPARPLARGERSPLRLRDLRAVLIGTSTGGPVALQKVLTALPENFPLPLLLVQHMPASFTPAFAQRLDSLCAIRVREAADGDMLEPGLALLAPGGMQMVVEPCGAQARVRIVESEPGQHYKPSVDVTFRSAVPVFGGQVLAVIMTGMGADGREGVRELREKGARVWAQDEQTSVVYGMPAAVAEAGLADRILPLEQIGPQITGGM
ncbi:chemotaxis response regulator protein-glutamate methylesterase [Thioalkalivibrio denitrificans]|uniref:Protein-glutamate methylesterase/protein-glutamine glutaminase n=1 Tax=Thioalkalivibrio denitrificans TaxID=108003 RepID=A0A1V3NM54_9GAMM|nr:chemotaxis response regulator protein-glutamate methylesterase [Thioalkalivibrio denitrificans]OOG26207.1 chemotaxis response regulator protein-glutamate methylesterase [Thioalkalivibrio denitrificans]